MQLHATRTALYDPTGVRHGGMPTYPWRLAPDDLLTRRQLRARGLRPGGQDPAAQLIWRHGACERVAYLYRLDGARPVRPMTPGRARALDAAMLARRTCPECRIDRGYCMPTSLGRCWPCESGEQS